MSLVCSIQVLTDGKLTLHNEHGIPIHVLLNGLYTCRCLYKTWMEGTCDIPDKNPYFFMTTEPNRMVFF